MKLLLLGIVAIFLSGCMNLTLHTSQTNPSVKPVLAGSDCIPIILGFGFGTATVDEAVKEGSMEEDRKKNRSHPYPIHAIHSTALTTVHFLGIGQQCVEVTGEPKP
jgi:hypothetical protein